MSGSRWLSRDTVVDDLVSELEITRASCQPIWKILGPDYGGMQYNLRRKGADISDQLAETCRSNPFFLCFSGAEAGWSCVLPKEILRSTVREDSARSD